MAKKGKTKAKYNWGKGTKVPLTGSPAAPASGSLRNGLLHLFLPQFNRMQTCVITGARDFGGSTGGPRTIVHPMLGSGIQNATGYNITLQFLFGVNASTPEYTIAAVMANPGAAEVNAPIFGQEPGFGNSAASLLSDRFHVWDTSDTGQVLTIATALTTEQQSGGWTISGRIGADRTPVVAVQSVGRAGGTGGANNNYTARTGTQMGSAIRNLNNGAASAGFGIMNNSGGSTKNHQATFFIAIWNRRLTDAEDRAWHDDPFSLIQNKILRNSVSSRRNTGGGRSFGTVIS